MVNVYNLFFKDLKNYTDQQLRLMCKKFNIEPCIREDMIDKLATFQTKNLRLAKMHPGISVNMIGFTTDRIKAHLGVGNLRFANLSNANLANADLHDEDLTGADLSNATLSNANFNGATLANANISRTNLQKINLNGANLNGANLNEANLYEATLVEANLDGANLSEADLTNANLSKAQLFKANLREANLSEANLSEANLSEANLSEANLHFANLFKATLDAANLSKANLHVTNLRFVNLSNTNLSGTDLSRANLTNAILPPSPDLEESPSPDLEESPSPDSEESPMNLEEQISPFPKDWYLRCSKDSDDILRDTWINLTATGEIEDPITITFLDVHDSPIWVDCGERFNFIRQLRKSPPLTIYVNNLDALKNRWSKGQKIIDDDGHGSMPMPGGPIFHRVGDSRWLWTEGKQPKQLFGDNKRNYIAKQVNSEPVRFGNTDITAMTTMGALHGQFTTNQIYRLI